MWVNQTSNVWKLLLSRTCDSSQMPNLKKIQIQTKSSTNISPYLFAGPDTQEGYKRYICLPRHMRETQQRGKAGLMLNAEKGKKKKKSWTMKKKWPHHLSGASITCYSLWKQLKYMSSRNVGIYWGSFWSPHHLNWVSSSGSQFSRAQLYYRGQALHPSKSQFPGH